MNARSDPATTPAKSTPGARAKGAGEPAPLEQALLRDVRVTLNATLGEVSMSVADLMALENGAVLTLDRALNELVDLHLNDILVARGEVVAVGDRFGVRIVEVGPTA